MWLQSFSFVKKAPRIARDVNRGLKKYTFDKALSEL